MFRQKLGFKDEAWPGPAPHHSANHPCKEKEINMKGPENVS